VSAEGCFEGRMMLKKLNSVRFLMVEVYDRATKRPLQWKPFLQSDSGVSTVEWVALAAGLVIGSIVVAFIVMQGLVGAANNISNQLK
jgi:hypothetical protein